MVRDTALVVLLALALLWLHPAVAEGGHPERWYQRQWCEARGGQTEFVLADKTRVDCLTGSHAVEVDRANKWPEAIGQSLHYAMHTGKKAGILLIVGPDEQLHLERLNAVIRHYGLPIDVSVVAK